MKNDDRVQLRLPSEDKKKFEERCRINCQNPHEVLRVLIKLFNSEQINLEHYRY